MNPVPRDIDRRLSVAPMMDWTDRWCRLFHRALGARTLLYTEMVTTGAVLHGDRDRLLGFDGAEQPVALQLGGSDPAALAESARIAEARGYAEVNLNVGCPSDRVQSGRFGACLMAEPALVRDCVAAMIEAVSIPVTVKSRLGIDDHEGYGPLARFVETLRASGCRVFIVHARKAWLKGLSPKENREVPPLHHDLVHRLKADHPDLSISINGGIATLDQALSHLDTLDGVMIGRAAYQTPYDILADADRRVFAVPGARPPSRHAVARALLPAAERLARDGQPVARLTRHMSGLFAGRPGSRAWKRFLAENAHKPGTGPEVLEAALDLVPEDDGRAEAA